MRKLITALTILATFTMANACNLEIDEIFKTVNGHVMKAKEYRYIDGDNLKAIESYELAIVWYKDIYRNHCGESNEAKQMIINKIREIEFQISCIELEQLASSL